MGLSPTTSGRTGETGEIPESERAVGEDAGSEDNSGPCGHQSTWGCDSHDGGAAPEDLRSNI